MKQTGEYRKHAYWLATEEVERLREEMKGSGIRLSTAKGIVCTPLDEINRISVVPPSVWNETCARPGSWYRNSERNGLSLVVSAWDIESLRHRKTAVITLSDFAPPKTASEEDKREMTRDPAFEDLVPAQWGLVPEREKRIYLRWAARMGSAVKEYAFLFLTHTANHANFIMPRFFVERDGRRVPYSIDVSAHLCSCCLELFQVLGREHRLKLVRPCPGAVIFARLEPDRYLMVENPEAR
ncbi:MAG: hypothetical protein C4576_12800 [Desulfobacteraceae bacterium]|nr:MAG: hypothetical protein C4576_12800 [Desulfobacteraceae bacterium]